MSSNTNKQDTLSSQQTTATTPTTTTTTEPGLSDNERDEMKALQDERKATEGHMSDSHRLRLSELQNREEAGKKQSKEERKAETTTTTTTSKESRSATAK